MFTFSIFDGHDHGASARRRRGRLAPRVEGLEGRRLLSGLQGNHIGSAMIAMAQTNVAGDRPETVRFYQYD
jgi:hypothetical protein